MLLTQENYFREQNLMDIRIVSTYGFDENDLSAIENANGVKAVYPTYSKDVFVRNDKNASVIAKLMAVPDSGMNEVVLLEGRLPENPGECLVEKHSQLKVVHEIGDTVSVYTTDPDDPIEDSLARTEWEVVGIVMSPQYIAYDRGTSTIGDGSSDTYIMVPSENFVLEVYTDVYVTLSSTAGISPFKEEYSSAVEIASEDFEKIAEERAPERLSEIKNEAYEEIDDAKAEIADAETELADAETELADAYAELTDGEKELADGWKEYYEGLAEYNDGLKEFDEEIAKAEKDLKDAGAKIADGWEQYYAAYDEYQKGLAEFEAGLAASGTSIDELYSNRTKLENIIAQYENVPGMEGMVANLKVQLESLNFAINSYEQLLEGGEKLEEAREDLIKGEKKIDKGWEEFEEAKKDGRKELSDAKKELNEGYIDLKDAEKKLADGWEEYYEGLEEFEDAKAEADVEIADAKKEIADAEKELADLKEPKWYVFDRNDNPGYSSYESDVAIIDSVGKVFPIFFFLVAMLVCLTTMTRMVEEQRTQIGTMKALGYDKKAILTKYIVYSAFASISGAVFGIAACAVVFPLIIYSAYAMRYVVPSLQLEAMPGTWVIVVAVCVLCTSLAVIMAGYSELRENPAELMRPKAPKAGKRVLLERIPFIWKRLSFTKKVTVRNLFRYKKRIFMTILGIAGCAALTLTGFGILSSISGIFEKQYEEIFSYDLIVSLDADSGKEKTDEVMKELESSEISERNLPVHIMSASYEGIKNLSVVATADPDLLEEMVLFRNPETGEVYELSEDGIIVTQRFAEKFGLSAGDEITFGSDEKEFTSKITSVAENYTAHFIYMTEGLYEKLCGEAPEINGVFVIMSDNGEKTQEEFANRLMEYESVLALTFSKESMESLQSVVENLNYVVILIIVCAAALAFVVLYNLTNINITERIREIATIKVLGFYDNEVSHYVFRENIILSIIGSAAGLFLGTGLHAFVMNSIQTDDVMFGKIIPIWAFASAFAMTVLFAALVNGIMHFRLKKISMVESLKSIE